MKAVLREVSAKKLLGKQDDELIVLNKDDLFKIVELQRTDKQAKAEYSLFGKRQRLRSAYSQEVQLADGRIRIVYDVSARPERKIIVYEDGKRQAAGRYKVKKSLSDGKWRL